MPHFSEHSLMEIDTLDERLQALCWEVIEHVDFRVEQGERSKQQQDEYFAAGKSKTPWPTSKHNCQPGQKSRAMDLVPCPIDWDDKPRFYLFAGFVLGMAAKMGIPLRCGADWDGDFTAKDQTFHDLGHFELEDE